MESYVSVVCIKDSTYYTDFVLRSNSLFDDGTRHGTCVLENPRVLFCTSGLSVCVFYFTVLIVYTSTSSVIYIQYRLFTELGARAMNFLVFRSITSHCRVVIFTSVLYVRLLACCTLSFMSPTVCVRRMNINVVSINLSSPLKATTTTTSSYSLLDASQIQEKKND
jgi:hypothetical protein